MRQSPLQGFVAWNYWFFSISSALIPPSPPHLHAHPHSRNAAITQRAQLESNEVAQRLSVQNLTQRFELREALEGAIL